MEEIDFQVAKREDYQELTRWLVRVSQAPEQHCLHTWSGQSSAGLRQQLLGYLDDSELCYLLALHDGRLAGAMGAEYDEELGRGWLHGPHVFAGDWDPIAAELFGRLLAELPSKIQQFDVFLNVENKRARRFYARRGFEEREHASHDFWLVPGDRIPAGERGCVPIGEEQEASFKQLYAALFPTAYYSADRVLQMESHRVFVAAEGARVLGFAVTSVEEGDAGEVQFLGVREDCRRQGYGRRLLLSAVEWLLDVAGVSRVTLNVGDELVQARGLYESVGFRLRFTGIGVRRGGGAKG
jgi:ribosomal protein S18 acetylase RimI-like enzyme